MNKILKLLSSFPCIRCKPLSLILRVIVPLITNYFFVFTIPWSPKHILHINQDFLVTNQRTHTLGFILMIWPFLFAPSFCHILLVPQFGSNLILLKTTSLTLILNCVVFHTIRLSRPCYNLLEDGVLMYL